MCSMSERMVSQHPVPLRMLWLHQKKKRSNNNDHNLASAPCYSSTVSKWSSKIRLHTYDHNNPTTHDHSSTTVITYAEGKGKASFHCSSSSFVPSGKANR